LLKQYSASWRELAGSVDFASKEFKEATAEAARLDAQIAKAEGRNRKAGSRLKTGAQVAGTAVAAGIFGGPEAAIGAVAGGIAGGVPGAVLGSTIGATVSQLRQALGATAAYEAEIKKLEIALKGVTTNQIEYNDALKFIQTSTNNYAVTQDILQGNSRSCKLQCKGQAEACKTPRLPLMALFPLYALLAALCKTLILRLRQQPRSSVKARCRLKS
jgi:hypothetical protein